MRLSAMEPSPRAKRPDALDFLFKKGPVWIMGVLNATPDSFYAGSRAGAGGEATARACALLDEGAQLLDLGAESTRPGALPVTETEELNRLLPVVEGVLAERPEALLSIDTRKARVAHTLLRRGASLINDISALRADPEMAGVVAEAQCPVILMHMQGTPEMMQRDPRYSDVVIEVKGFLEERLAAAVKAGVPERRILLDPGIGFGKTLEHNVTLLRRLSELAALGRPLLVGLSRKAFLGRLASSSDQPLPAEDRLEGTLAANLWATLQGAQGLRVHDVAATLRSLRVWQALTSPA
jgi:dihydropteroate synthase